MKKIVIIGAGGMLSSHIEGFRNAGAEVIGLCDVDIQKAKAMAKNFSIEKTFDSFSAMLKECPEIDAVSIITPNKFHCPLVTEALEKGLHVFCEKPPALNANDMIGMYETAKKSGKTLMFNFNNRARPESIALMQYIKNGDVGTINSSQATWIRRAGIPGFGGWFTNKALSGGGPVIDLLHMLDLALYFMNYPEVDYVLARTFDTFMDNESFKGPWGIPDVKDAVNDVEAACHAFITFKTGQCLTLRSSWAEMNEREVVSVVFQGTKAGGKMERLFGTDGLDETSFDSCKLFTEENGNQVDREIHILKDSSMGRITNIKNFIEVLAGNTDPLNTPDQAVTLMKIIDAIYQSQKINAPVKL
ncbi:MAG: Gfo/Idh/MocA family oxidoreductase [Spirochaetales bacterium]